MNAKHEWTARHLDDERRLFETIRFKHPNRRRHKDDAAWHRRALADYR